MIRAAFLLPCVVLAACHAAAQQPAPGARADFIDANGTSIGSATLAQQANAVVIRTSLHGLPAGTHGFHVHAVGKCEPPFQSAGSHFNPANKKHGLENPEGPHAGDLVNLIVDVDGSAHSSVLRDGADLERFFDADGSALVIHAAADDYKSDPAGNAGSRIACAVIRRASS